MEDEYTEADSVRDLAVSCVGKKDIEGSPYVVVPEGYGVEDLSSKLLNPVRQTGETIVKDVESFKILYDLNAIGTTIFKSDSARIDILVSFNEGITSEPGHKDHYATLALEKSHPYSLLGRYENKSLTQKEFADFLERMDAYTPDGEEGNPKSSELMKMVRSFKDIRKVSFGQDVDKKGDVISLNYANETQRGSVEYPSVLKFILPVFKYGDDHVLEVRLSHKIEDEKLRFYFNIWMKSEFEVLAFEHVVDKVKGFARHPVINV